VFRLVFQYLNQFPLPRYTVHILLLFAKCDKNMALVAVIRTTGTRRTNTLQ